MFLELVNVIGLIYLWTWFIWPFIFVASLVNAIRNLVKEESTTTNVNIASVALLVIICGIQFGLVGGL